MSILTICKGDFPLREILWTEVDSPQRRLTGENYVRENIDNK